MASIHTRQQRDPLLDQNTQALLERRGREVIGIALIIAAILFGGMLATYSPDDPGWMAATDAPAQNMLGRFGAAITSTLMIIGGKGMWAVALILGGWGVRYVAHIGAERAFSRVVFAVLAVAVSSVFASTLLPPADWVLGPRIGLGGMFGDMVLGALLTMMPMDAGISLNVLSMILGAATVALVLWVMGFTLAELGFIGRFLRHGSAFAYDGLVTQAARGTRNATDRLRDARAAQPMPARGRMQPRVTGHLTGHDDPMFDARADIDPALGATDWGNDRRAAPRGAAPQYGEPAPYAPPREKQGLFARLMAEPEPELYDPIPLHDDDLDAPDDNRIRSRISDAIRARAQAPAEMGRAEPPLTHAPAGPFASVTRAVRGAAQRQTARLREEPAVMRGQATDAPAFASRRVATPPVDAPDLPPIHAYEAERNWMPDMGPEINDDDALIDDFDPAPRPRMPSPPPAAAPDRRSVVQHTAKRAPAPSRRAMDEAQPRLRFDEPPASRYELPPLSLLSSPVAIQRTHLSDEALEENARMLENVLDDYGVKGEISAVRPGPVVTMYELDPAPGLKASRVIGLADDIARSMSALSARVSTLPGRNVIGIELPNATREKVVLREILAARDFGDSAMRLPLALGKDIGGDPVVANLAKMPHLLIAGTTGSGKSVAINTMILSLLYKLTPEDCRMIMIDPKMLELSVYDGIPHLLSPVVTDPKKAVVALKWVVGEMEERYRKMSKMGVRNIEGYNGRVREALDKGEMFKRTIQTGFDDETGDPVFETEEFEPQTFPYIVVIVDEMADLMMVAGKEIEACIQRLAQMARASGIHLIMATQRPSVDVITGTIKANFPTRISFQVTSKIDSRTILGEQGAEQLLGMGDMLYMGNGAKITRIHGPFVSDEEVEEIVNHLKSFGPPSYMSGVVEGPEDDAASDIDAVLGLGGGDGEDALYDQAVAIVAKDRKCSTSYIQRKLGIGYNKAARLVEQMEEQGVVTPANHVGKREILVPEV